MRQTARTGMKDIFQNIGRFRNFIKSFRFIDIKHIPQNYFHKNISMFPSTRLYSKKSRRNCQKMKLRVANPEETRAAVIDLKEIF